MVNATGQVGQGLNFAINGQTLKMFMDANNVKYRSSSATFSKEKSAEDISDDARKWTTVIECWGAAPR